MDCNLSKYFFSFMDFKAQKEIFNKQFRKINGKRIYFEW